MRNQYLTTVWLVRGDYIIIDVDYDDRDKDEMKYIIELSKITDGDYEEDEKMKKTSNTEVG